MIRSCFVEFVQHSNVLSMNLWGRKWSPLSYPSAILAPPPNSFSGRFPISSSFVWLGGHFSCSFTCWVFLCFFILFRLLCLEWPFCILVVCGSFLLWRFLPLGGVGQVACQGFLVREACVSVLVHGTGFPLSGVQLSVQ